MLKAASVKLIQDFKTNFSIVSEGRDTLENIYHEVGAWLPLYYAKGGKGYIMIGACMCSESATRVHQAQQN